MRSYQENTMNGGSPILARNNENVEGSHEEEHPIDLELSGLAARELPTTSAWDKIKHKIASVPLVLVFPIIGMVMLTGSYLLYQSEQAFVAQARKVQGIVVTPGTKHVKPQFRYVDEKGREQFVYISDTRNFSRPEAGDTEALLYLPGQPDKTRIDSLMGTYPGTTVLGMMGSLFFLLGMLIVLLTISDVIAAVYRKLFWTRIETWLQTIEQSPKPRKDGVYSYRFITKRLHPKTKRMRTYKSEFVLIDPNDYANVTSLFVYVAPGKSKKYFMDVPNLAQVASPYESKAW